MTREQIEVWRTALLACPMHRPEDTSEVNALCDMAQRYRLLRQCDAGGIQVYDCANDPERSLFEDELDAAVDGRRLLERTP